MADLNPETSTWATSQDMQPDSLEQIVERLMGAPDSLQTRRAFVTSIATELRDGQAAQVEAMKLLHALVDANDALKLRIEELEKRPPL
jgi:hypothetical protein